MKNLYSIAIFIASLLLIFTTHAQDLEWTNPEPTGAGNATIAINAGSVLVNGDPISSPALIGVFYTNSSGGLSCGGYVDLSDSFINDGNGVAISAWGGDDEVEFPGFDTGETLNFYLNLNGVDYPSTSLEALNAGTFEAGLETIEWVANGLFVLNEIDFAVDASTVLGCTCPYTDNYDPLATVDDGSCILEEGCLNPLADNDGSMIYDALCSGIIVTVENDNCEIPGCICTIAYNFDEGATVDNGTCFILDVTGSLDFCTDPTASNFTEGCEGVTIAAGEENCEYGNVVGECELENIDWTFTVTDANMTIQVYQDVVTLNGEEPPCGSLLGGFFTTDSGELACAGYQTWCSDFDNGQLAVALMASETGADNGFATGEEITWLLKVGSQTFSPDEISMFDGAPFSTTFVANGFGQLLDAHYNCDITGIPGCTNQNASNYDADATIDDGSCLVLGCIDETACNYNEDALEDDGSCIYEQTWYQDSDGDGLGNPAINTTSCDEISGFVTNGDDPCPNNSDNPNNITVWYLDEDGDGLGSDTYIFGDDENENGCVPPGGLVDNNDDPCIYDPDNLDEDGDGICDDIDNCVGILDAIGECNGSCTDDIDGDLICDDVDNCIGVYDECGTCDNDPTNDCIQDCAGVWGGDSLEDNCGTCDNDPTNDCTQDCAGVWGGDSLEDNCGTCDNDPTNDCTQDCAGVWGGDSLEDNCGTCDNDPTNNCTQDCAGVWGGDSLEDNCGTCDNDPTNDCTQDCAGVWGGDSLEDNCGTCDNDLANDCTQDCAGEWGGPLTIDALGVCGGYCEADTDGDGVCDIDEIEGCQDETACNYNSSATDDCNEIEGFEYLSSFEGHNYYISNEPVFTWGEANNLCSGTNGYLVSINSEEENNFILEILLESSELYSPAIWIGLFQNDEGTANESYVNDSGDWEWTDGTTLNYDENDNGWSTYANWSPFEPNNANELEGENYGNFWIASVDNNPNQIDGTWNDCDDECFDGDESDNGLFFIVEIDESNTCCTYAAEGESCSGCTDETACNYSASATSDDGTCLYEDSDGDGVCDVDEIEGCQDPYACNYNPLATDPYSNEEQVCLYPNQYYDCNNICLNDIDGDEVCDELEIEGCTDQIACNFNEIATDSCVECCIYLDGICETCEDGQVVDNDIDDDQVCNNDEITGCQDQTACNYDNTATDAGECVYEVEFYDCDNICINDVDGDGVCDELEVVGCTDQIACNFSEIATDPCFDTDGNTNGCCIYLDGICETCEDGQIVDNDIDDDLVCDDDEIPGCTDPTACNYDESLGCTDDDGSCFYSEITVDFSTQPASCEAICDGEIELTINNGQPPFFVEYILNGEDGFETTITGGGLINACTGSYLVVVSDAFNCESEAMMIVVGATEFDTDGDGVCDNDELQGCTDENACNFNPLATEEDNSCEYCYSDLGDIDGNGFDDCELINNQALENGNNAVYDCNGCINDSDFDGVCDELEVVGCTDNNLDSTNGIACNYNELATDPCLDTNNDGVLDCCEYPIYYYLDCDENCLNDSDGDGVCDEIEVNGCNDILACNYDEEATESGNCVYAIEFYDCNNICINDIDGDGVCDELEVEGCQNGEACNFNPLATDPCADCCAFVDADQDGFPEFITSVQSIQDIDCAANSATGYSPGAFLIYTTGGLGPYTLTMDNVEEYSDDGIFEIEGLSGGSYNIFVSDANGCETLETIDIQQPDQFEITIEYLNYVSCENYFDGALTGSVQGGTPPYELEWLAADGTVLSTDQDVNNLVAGIYAFKVTDANGCTYQEVTNVGNPNPLELDFLTIGETTCYGGSDGYVEILVTGGTGPYTDIYTDINGSNVNPNLLSAGDYTVTITDNNNCVWIDEFTITEPDPVEVSIQANETEICEEEMVTIVSVPDNFSSYIWSEEGSGNIFADNDSSIINIAETGNYMLTVIDANGCEATSNIVEVIVYENPEIVINGTTEVLGNNTYTYYVTGQGQQYEWSIEDPDMGTINGNNNESSVSITWNLEGVSEIYLTQTSEFGCSTTESIEVTIEWPTYLEEELEELEFTVYPNPFTNYTNIEVNNPNNLNYNLYLYDIKGVMVKAFINETRKAIKLEETLSSGIYQLQLISSTGNRRKLIVVE